MYAWQCSEQFFQILAHLILIIRTHYEFFKDEGSKAQTLRNTQGHVPSKWKSWNLNPNNLVPKSRLNGYVSLCFPRFYIVYPKM